MAVERTEESVSHSASRAPTSATRAERIEVALTVIVLAVLLLAALALTVVAER